MSEKKIGILTGGGDVPGLNSVIKSVVYRSSEMGRSVVGIRRGWEGLTHVAPDLIDDPRYVRPLNRENTRAIDRSGGTVLHTSRTNPWKTKPNKIPPHLVGTDISKFAKDDDLYDLTPIVLENLDRLGIGTLIAIGGDDTLSYAARLHSEGFPVVAIPKTMDNDVRNTEYCIGFSTAITRAKEAITRQRTTCGSHERIGVFRIFGRDAGFTALYTSYVTSTRCLIPEHVFDIDRLCELLMEDKHNNPSNYSLVVISEGATWAGRGVAEYGDADAYGHKKKVDVGEALAMEIKKRTGEDTMASDLTYDLRSGDPDAIDHLVAITFANIALDMINEGVSGKMVGIQQGRYGYAEIPDPAAGARTVNIDKFYNTDRYRPRYDNKMGTPMLLEAI
ncbi:MAG: 6-phosphofructokinase [Acidobacteriota bacterium]|nr:MAG: 6-phosphofructokinase [Acidobacteriota bacterium]